MSEIAGYLSTTGLYWAASVMAHGVAALKPARVNVDHARCALWVAEETPYGSSGAMLFDGCRQRQPSGKDQ